ncbi:hypothetical protein PoB_004106700 [Plakobranchus ocellatus]|uniref:Uncharacterized protein n=1 Tax=Plakobranchus ocellatus TaxID=259542 RepID=A0AAV4B5V3_9GAST|nr:hypothetical protein PoB_004106700 [Plakobranchus ocellatus]
MGGFLHPQLPEDLRLPYGCPPSPPNPNHPPNLAPGSRRRDPKVLRLPPRFPIPSPPRPCGVRVFATIPNLNPRQYGPCKSQGAIARHCGTHAAKSCVEAKKKVVKESEDNVEKKEEKED